MVFSVGNIADGTVATLGKGVVMIPKISAQPACIYPYVPKDPFSFWSCSDQFPHFRRPFLAVFCTFSSVPSLMQSMRTRNYRWMDQWMVPIRLCSCFIVFLLFFFFSPTMECQETPPARNCLDYNTLSNYGTSVGIPEKDLFFCPNNDTIAGIKCAGKLPVKANLTDVLTPSHPLTWKDVAVYMMYGKDYKNREKVLDWWIVLYTLDFPDQRLDFIMIGPSCGTAMTCNDGASILANHINETYKNNIAIHFMRGRPPDDGRSRLACKALYSMINMYEQFPHKQYFLKVDDDSVWFPNRMFRFFQTLDRIHEVNLPVYFGSVLNGHKPVELCGAPFGPVISRQPPYYRLDDKVQRENRTFSYDVCYAGGAFYGMNRPALAAFLNTTLCTMDMDLEYDDEDGWVGYWLYKKLQVQVIHCGSIRPHWYNHEDWYTRAINYHRVNNDFVHTMNITELLTKYDL